MQVFRIAPDQDIDCLLKTITVGVEIDEIETLTDRLKSLGELSIKELNQCFPL